MCERSRNPQHPDLPLPPVLGFPLHLVHLFPISAGRTFQHGFGKWSPFTLNVQDLLKSTSVQCKRFSDPVPGTLAAILCGPTPWFWVSPQAAQSVGSRLLTHSLALCLISREWRRQGSCLRFTKLKTLCQCLLDVIDRQKFRVQTMILLSVQESQHLQILINYYFILWWLRFRLICHRIKCSIMSVL